MRPKFSTLIRFAIFSVLLLSCIQICSAVPLGHDTQIFIELERDWATARTKGDVDFLERFYAKELRLNIMSGRVVSREEDIALFKSRQILPDAIIDEDLSVTLYGDTAVVTGIEKVRGTYKGQPGEYVLRFTNVFVVRDERWQLVAHQSTQIK